MNFYLLTPLYLTAAALTPKFVLLVAGPEYQEAIIPGMLLTLFAMIQFGWQSTLGRSIFVLKPSLSRFKFSVINSVSLLLFLLSLGYYFGLAGVVIARLCSTVVTGIVAYFYIRNEVNLKIDLTLVFTSLLASVVLAGCVVLSQTISESLVAATIGVFIGVTCYFTIVNYSIPQQYGSLLVQYVPIASKILDFLVPRYNAPLKKAH